MEKDTKIVLVIIAIVIVALTIIFILIKSNTLKSTIATPSLPTVYKDIDYSGNSQTYGEGSYTLSQMQARGTENDSISSIEVPAGYKVTLYQDDNFKGNSIVKLANDTNFVNEDWNDKVSSMVVTKIP